MRRAISLDVPYYQTPMACGFCGAPSPKERHNLSDGSMTVCMCEACLKQSVAAMQAACAER